MRYVLKGVCLKTIVYGCLSISLMMQSQSNACIVPSMITNRIVTILYIDNFQISVHSKYVNYCRYYFTSSTFMHYSYIFLSDAPAPNPGNPVFTCDKDFTVKAQTLVTSPSKSWSVECVVRLLLLFVCTNIIIYMYMNKEKNLSPSQGLNLGLPITSQMLLPLRHQDS